MAPSQKTIKLLLDRFNLTEFEKSVLLEVSRTKKGELLTYKELASRIKKPRSYRSVGNALNKNPFPILIPCHRVISKNGLGGYKYGRRAKRLLISLERQHAASRPAVFRH